MQDVPVAPTHGNPGHTGADGHASVEPGSENVAVDAQALAAFDTTEEARTLARITADRDLLMRLQLEGFAGPAYDHVERELIRYGHAVLSAWIASGQVFRERTRKHFRPTIEAPLDRDVRRALREHATGLAAEVVMAAAASFKTHVLLKNKWVPEAGASLTTYFVGRCLLEFHTVYRTWHRGEVRRLRLGLRGLVGEDGRLALDPVEPGPSVEREVLGRLGLDELVRESAEAFRRRSARKTTRAVLELVGAGLSHEQIANRLDITTRAVEGVLYQVRQRSRRAA